MNAVGATLRRILPIEAALVVWEGEDEPELYPEEAGAIERAVDKRAKEFRRGRACARAALAQLGVTPGPIPVGLDRAPTWPEGFVGSITHCAGLVAAVAARSDQIAGIGIDAEPARPLPASTHRHILHPDEKHGDEEAVLDMAVFSAKESIHKTLFPLTGVRLAFLDVVVQLDLGEGRFSVSPAPDAGARAPRLDELCGRFAVSDGYVLAACWLEPR